MTFFVVIRANVVGADRDQADEFVRWWADEHQGDYLERSVVATARVFSRLPGHTHAAKEPRMPDSGRESR
jgi:hypothetical protein